MLNIQKDIIIGSLLSDGCITKVPKCRNYYLTQHTKHEEYAKYMQQMVPVFSRCCVSKSGSGGTIGTRKVISHGGFVLSTKTSEYFTELREQWYPNGKKIVPQDITLSPTSVLHWYLGDGTMDSINGISLCTDSFSHDDNTRLANLLNQFTEAKVNHKNRIHIPNKGVWEFLQYIGVSPVECFEYKWNTIVDQSYYNRRCQSCDMCFDATQNHQRFCSSKCCQREWKLRKRACPGSSAD